MALRFIDAGAVTLAAGSQTVTGAGVDWSSVSADDAFQGPDGRLRRVLSVVSSNQLTLAHAWDGADVSGASYTIIADPTAAQVAAMKGRHNALADKIEAREAEFATWVSGTGTGTLTDWAGAARAVLTPNAWGG